MESHVCPTDTLYPMCPSYSTVPYRTGGIVLYNSMCPTDTLYPMCPSYPTVPCMTGHGIVL